MLRRALNITRVLTLVTATLPASPSSPPAQSVELHRGEAIRFAAPGPAAVLLNIKCGPRGDLYAVYNSTASGEMGDAPIRKVSPSSRTVTEYPIPTISGYEKLTRVSFNVSADGTLYALLQDTLQTPSESKADPVYLIVKYKDDGRVDSHVAIGEVPGKRSEPRLLAVFADGSSLVSGTTVEKTADGTSLGAFTNRRGNNHLPDAARQHRPYRLSARRFPE